MSDISEQREYFERMIDEIGADYRKQIEQIKAENTRLRSCLSDTEEHASAFMWEVKQLEDERDKLRELVRDYDKVLDNAVYVWGTVADFLGYGRKYDALHDRMREFGIEVES